MTNYIGHTITVTITDNLGLESADAIIDRIASKDKYQDILEGMIYGYFGTNVHCRISFADTYNVSVDNVTDDTLTAMVREWAQFVHDNGAWIVAI